MREILFRGKSIETGEWVYGVPAENVIDHSTMMVEVLTELEPMDEIDEEYSNSLCTEVYPYTVCQYTGYTDKDGKKIFDGDVLEVRFVRKLRRDIYDVYVVWWIDGGFRAVRAVDFGGDNGYGVPLPSLLDREVKATGFTLFDSCFYDVEEE